MAGIANDVVLREHLKNRTLRSRFDSLSIHLDSSGVCFDHVTRVLSCCIPLVFIFTYFLVFSGSRKEHDIRTRAALQALLTIVVPTCSLWPRRYIQLAGLSCPYITIPLEIIMKDAGDGVIEFRNPIHDLADLIGSGAAVNGHTICIIIGWRWWMDYFEWWITVKPKSGTVPDRPNNIPSATNTSSLGLPLSISVLNASTSFPSIFLDLLPPGTTPPINVGCKATLEFTAFSPSLRALSTAKIISAVPFIFSERFPRRPRSLASVLKQLNASYGPGVVVSSVSNISEEYGRTLHDAYFAEQNIRDLWVKSGDIGAWRQDMFLVALEAALLRRGWVERWAIQVTVK